MIFKRKFSFAPKQIAVKVLKKKYALGEFKNTHCITLDATIIAFKLNELNQLPELTGNRNFDNQNYFATRGAYDNFDERIQKEIFVNAENIVPKLIQWMEFRMDFFESENVTEIKVLYDKL